MRLHNMRSMSSDLLGGPLGLRFRCRPSLLSQSHEHVCFFLVVRPFLLPHPCKQLPNLFVRLLHVQQVSQISQMGRHQQRIICEDRLKLHMSTIMCAPATPCTMQLYLVRPVQSRSFCDTVSKPSDIGFSPGITKQTKQTKRTRNACITT